jgi:hypothetical protein
MTQDQKIIRPKVSGVSVPRAPATVAAQRFRHRLHFAGRDTLDIHLGQGTHQGLLRALVALEQFR